MSIEIKVPDIGDFKDVPIIEILVKAGDTIKPEDPLVVLESDKATMEVPAPQAGVVKELKVKVGDRVGEGAVLLLMEGEAKAAAAPTPPPAAPQPAASPAPANADLHAEVLVLGAGPGGYTAAFRAADLGAKVVLVERWNVLGGVCLNVGCIPSKALLHAAKVVDEANDMAEHGISFGAPTVDLGKLRDWKKSVVQRLTGGLAAMAKQRKVTVVTGQGAFASANTLEVTGEDGKKIISFDKAIIAAGSEPVTLPFIPHDDPRVMDSTGALALADIPKKLLVLGGGIIGLEMATVYAALGSKVTIVELMDQIIPGADKDIVTPLSKRFSKKAEILLKTKVTAVKAEDAGLRATLEGPDGTREDVFEKLLVAVGRKPNGKLIAVEKAGVTVDERGFIPVDKQMRTNVGHIFAIGDVVGQPMLAHKATHEAKVAAEVACGHKSAFDAKVIPSVAYTDPEVAWVGVTENEAKASGQKFGKAVFPWAASGRALSLGRDEGLTKAIFDEDSKRLIGVGIVGVGAGDLIAEAALAIELGAEAEDIGLTIHPHPTLSETIGMAAELFEGTITDLIPPKKRK
ncbi:dihydrolipoyl dehydrogenase [Rhodoblastus acidophilus]|uniref:Dihydrolipoyl dehydrogenase n=1 Tax=Rhodoblastus acidophilus TaxID=1074 RepID=A0A6N8DKP7_RHOAC|nr:dihydrolipoyl dehydrogenase [Rhodoblastus acidophilus]MCW2273889.1 dihydrolipoamide dehydrogenase [Rhodoblastus acidophilus]MTV30967.1 dihydrolipoyl dehydrogenase [Rhodoblastus acidophilus]